MEALLVKVLIVVGLSLFSIIEMAIVNIQSTNALQEITPPIALADPEIASTCKG